MLNQLQSISSRKGKRIGRGVGSGVGGKSTRGTKRHQAAREKIALGFEGGQGRITKKFPLLRGKQRNKPTRIANLVIKTGALNKLKKGSSVSLETLLENKLVSVKARTRGVKIVAGGDLEVDLIISIPTSLSAKAIIEAAGGKVNPK